MADETPRPPDDDKLKKAAPKEDTGQLWKAAGIGLELTVAMLLAVALGKWLDGKYGWSPWGTLVVSMLALSAVLYGILKDVNK